MQAGALRALLEAGYQPALLTGTSIGAANAAFLAVHGYSDRGIEELARVWRSTVDKDLLPVNLWSQMMRAFFRRSIGASQERIREFAIANGLTPDLRFMDLAGPRLFLVASDLNTGCPAVFGTDPQESVLDAVLASMALPPWMAPQEHKGRYLIDGGVVSNLPVETALNQGAEEIIALDLLNPNDVDPTEHGIRPFFWKLNQTMETRNVNLELELARSRGVKVFHVSLTEENAVPLWDFRHSAALIDHGYEITRQAVAEWKRLESRSWRSYFHLPRRVKSG